jgi:ribulose-phosphate 3-epimerase
LDRIHALGCKAGIVLKPGTPAEAAIPYLEKCDLILVMTVEPGFGGQKFMENMMPKVRKLRSMLDEVNPACLLEVDGGVDTNTCEICKKNGADVLVAGSAYFAAEDRGAFVKLIQA